MTGIRIIDMAMVNLGGAFVTWRIATVHYDTFRLASST
jgi:hypothetical protein